VSPAGDAWNHFDLPTALDLLAERSSSFAAGVTVGTATAPVPVLDWPAAEVCMPPERVTRPAGRGGASTPLARAGTASDAGGARK